MLINKPCIGMSLFASSRDTSTVVKIMHLLITSHTYMYEHFSRDIRDSFVQ